ASEVSRRCARAARVKDAGILPKELAFISPLGSGTRKGDRVELSAIAELLNGDRAALPISGMKPYTGHMGAASDIGEIALALTALKNGLVPATPNSRTPDAGFAEVEVGPEHRRVSARHVLSMSQGLGGQSMAIVVSAEPEAS